jgi:acetoin utilization protein AcuC
MPQVLKAGVILATKEKIFVHSDELKRYPYPSSCPFNISRADKTFQVLKSMGLLSGRGIKVVEPAAADQIALKKFHTARYFYTLKNASDGRFNSDALSMGIGTPDCPVFSGMYESAALACGGTLKGVDLILSRQADVVFNPSGGLHHARPEKAAGFCYMNDVALACKILAEAGKRLLYLDIDVHHGDGVQNAFYDSDRVMTISLHESGRMLFPGTGFADEIGAGPGKGYCVNIPLPPETYDEIYIKTFGEIVMPLIGSFCPDVIVFELGADGLAGDPLAHLALTNNVYAEIIEKLLSFDKPILATGGGGYNVENTVRAWALAWSVLSGQADSAGDNPVVGGVILESTDWAGGLRDRHLPVRKEQRIAVVPAVESTIEILKAKVLAIHGL